MRLLSQVAACALMLLPACGRPDGDTAEQTAAAVSPLSNKLIYFGNLEVLSGALKSADGTLPEVSGSATLRLFLPELGRFLCGASCMALSPHLFLRFNGSEDFQEIPGIPGGEYSASGPQASWPRDTTDVLIYFPSSADRIEAYMKWGRVSWNSATCYSDAGTTQCPDSFNIDDAYLSNYGRNFSIGVTGSSAR